MISIQHNFLCWFLSQTFQAASVMKLCARCIVTLDAVREKPLFSELVSGTRHGTDSRGLRSDGVGTSAKEGRGVLSKDPQSLSGRTELINISFC